MEIPEILVYTIVTVEVLLIVLLAFYLITDIISQLRRTVGSTTTVGSVSNIESPTKLKSNRSRVVLIIILMLFGVSVLAWFYKSDLVGPYPNVSLLTDTFILVSFSSIILFSLVGYILMGFIDRYWRLAGANSTKDVGISMSILFIFLLMATLIAYWISCVSLYDGNSVEFLIFWSSLLATFLSTVLADDQNQRIKNGTFGALAAGGITAVVSLVQQDKSESVELLLYSFFGSTLGALLGWFVFALIAFITFYKYGKMFPFVELITNGFGKFREQIILLENSGSSSQLQAWIQRLDSEIRTQIAKVDADKELKDKPKVLKVIHTQLIRFILLSIVEEFNFAFGTIKFRATIIRFDDKSDEKVGRHDFDLSYYGAARRFRDLPFDQYSMAYKVVSNQISDRSKTFDISDPSVQARDTRDRYVSFTLFHLDQKNVLSLDWGQQGAKDRLETLEDLLNSSVVPTLQVLVSKLEAQEGASMNQSQAPRELDSSPS